MGMEFVGLVGVVLEIIGHRQTKSATTWQASRTQSVTTRPATRTATPSLSTVHMT